MDDIEREVTKWQGVTLGSHKYGGLQFNHNYRELGHVHSNRLLDML